MSSVNIGKYTENLVKDMFPNIQTAELEETVKKLLAKAEKECKRREEIRMKKALERNIDLNKYIPVSREVYEQYQKQLQENAAGQNGFVKHGQQSAVSHEVSFSIYRNTNVSNHVLKILCFEDVCIIKTKNNISLSDLSFTTWQELCTF